MNKNNEKKPKYGMRKLSMGFVSCMLGFTMMFTPIANLGGFVTTSYAQEATANLEEPTYSGKTIHISDTSGVGDLKTALSQADNGDIIELDKNTSENFEAGFTIAKDVKIIGNGNQLAIRAERGAKINITGKVTLDNVDFSSRIESQGEFPIVVKSSYLKMKDVKLTNGGTGETFNLVINPVQSSDIANIIVEGTNSINFDKIEIGEGGQPLGANVQLTLNENVSSKGGLNIKNYANTEGRTTSPIIINKSKVTNFESENTNNDSTLVFDGVNRTISLSKIKNVELKNAASISLNSTSHISNTSFNLPEGTSLNLENFTSYISDAVSIYSVVTEPDQSTAGTIFVSDDIKLTVENRFNQATKIEVRNPSRTSRFTLELHESLTRNPNIVIFEGNTKIVKKDNTYTATVGKDEPVSERLGYVIEYGHDIEVEHGDNQDKILKKINEELKANSKTENVEAVSTNPAVINTSTPTPEGQQGELVEVTFIDKNNTNDTAKANVHIKVLKNASDKLAEKISKKIDDRATVTITHGQTDDELKQKVKELLGDGADVANISVSRVDTENLGNTVNKEGTVARFTFNQGEASAFKDITVKVVNNESDNLAEKIKSKIDPEELSFTQGTSKEDIKNAILAKVRKDASIANVNLEDFTLDTETVQTNSNVNLVFDLNGTKATLAKDISITARRLQEATLQQKIDIALENVADITIEHGKNDEDLKEKVRQELEKTEYTQGVTIDTVSPENLGNTVNEAGTRATFTFTKDSEHATKEILVKVLKNASDQAGEEAIPAPPSGGASGESGSSSSSLSTSSGRGHSLVSTVGVQNKETKKFKVSRISGKDRVETAINVAKKLYPNGADRVILVNKDTYADSLSAISLSNALKAPILYTNVDNIPESDIKAINELGAKNITIVGGDSSVSESQINTLLKNFRVDRISGSNRYDTATKVSEALLNINGKNTDEIVIASGEKFADALSISSYSAQRKIPVLLVGKSGISKDIRLQIEKRKNAKIYIIGGENSVSSSIENELKKMTNITVTRLQGSDRYETSKVVSQFAKPNATNAVIASGERFEDALIAGSLVANPGSTLLLGKSTSLTPQVEKYLNSSNIKSIDLVGGFNTLGTDYTQKLMEK